MMDTNGMELHRDVHGEGEPLLWLLGSLGHGPVFGRDARAFVDTALAFLAGAYR